jgi:SagB-type dehydrogenase family enzyme
MNTIKQHREFMRFSFASVRPGQSDQSRDVPQPPLQLPVDDDAEVIELPDVGGAVLKKNDLYACLKGRRSRREFSDRPLTINELSFLLWATQGVEDVVRNGSSTRRPVPSAGATHPYETHLVVNRVTDIAAGLYRYLPLSHELLVRSHEGGLAERVAQAACGQAFLARSAVIFVWACVPYRAEWRYHLAAHKAMLLDAGHICQNLYLACEAIECGTCAVAAYDQKAMDKVLALDGEDEFVVYMAPVGKR